jgi:hypothetical protein
MKGHPRDAFGYIDDFCFDAQCPAARRDFHSIIRANSQSLRVARTDLNEIFWVRMLATRTARHRAAIVLHKSPSGREQEGILPVGFFCGRFVLKTGEMPLAPRECFFM